MGENSDAELVSIQRVSELTGIPTTTLRYWEKTYGSVNPQRSVGRHRLYSARDVERLKWLKAKIDAGMSTSEAHRLLDEHVDRMEGLSADATKRGAIMILVAERDPVTAELERHFLTEEGFEVRVELNGRKAVVEAKKRKPDLIIVDVFLPGLSGLQVCQALKADPETASIPIIVFSALDLGDRALRAGADMFLLKPRDRGEADRDGARAASYSRAERAPSSAGGRRMNRLDDRHRGARPDPRRWLPRQLHESHRRACRAPARPCSPRASRFATRPLTSKA